MKLRLCVTPLVLFLTGCLSNLTAVPNSDDHLFTHYNQKHYEYKVLSEENHRASPPSSDKPHIHYVTEVIGKNGKVKINPPIVELAESCGGALNDKRDLDKALNGTAIALGIISAIGTSIVAYEALDGDEHNEDRAIWAFTFAAISGAGVPIVRRIREALIDPQEHKRRLEAYNRAVELAAQDQHSEKKVHANEVISKLVNCTYADVRPISLENMDQEIEQKIEQKVEKVLRMASPAEMTISEPRIVDEEIVVKVTSSYRDPKYTLTVKDAADSDVAVTEKVGGFSFTPAAEGEFTIELSVSDGESRTSSIKDKIKIAPKSDEGTNTR